MSVVDRKNILVVGADRASTCTLAGALQAEFNVETASSLEWAIRFLNTDVVDAALPNLPIVVAAIDAAASLADWLSLGLTAVSARSATLEALRRDLDRLGQSHAVRRRIPRWAQRHVDQAMAYVRQHYAEPIRISDIARAVGISESRLAHAFPVTTGMSVKKYVLRVRVELTKRALRETPDKLERIAELTGFCDAAHLSHVFRRHTDRWPGEFRSMPFFSSLPSGRERSQQDSSKKQQERSLI